MKSCHLPFDSSAGKESTCHTRDPGLVPGSGRSGEGKGYLLQYSWAFLMTQMAKNLPEVQESWVQSLGWEDPWRRAWEPTPVFLPGKSPGIEESGMLQFVGSESDMTE